MEDLEEKEFRGKRGYREMWSLGDMSPWTNQGMMSSVSST